MAWHHWEALACINPKDILARAPGCVARLASSSTVVACCMA